jgi:MazG family protein
MSDNTAAEKFSKLLEIVAKLRSPEGCPWDKKQTPQGMKPYLIEESHELGEAIDSGNPEHVKEELGDLFFQLSLISQMYAEKDLFDISDALQEIIDKMIRRHPHVFDNQSFSSKEELRQNWLKIKAEEKKEEKSPVSIIDVPKTLPALNRAQRVSHRAEQKGIRVSRESDITALSQKSLLLKQAVEQKDKHHVSALLGETLFIIANIGRSFDLYCEDLLQTTTSQFIRRYQDVEKLIESETGLKINEVDKETRQLYWDRSQENI